MRFRNILAVFVVSLASSAYAEPSYLSLEGQADASVTFHLKWQAWGVLAPPGVSGDLLASVDAGTDAASLRDLLTPKQGSQGIVRRRVHVDGKPVTEFPLLQDYQLWISTDTLIWHVLEPAVPFALSGITFAWTTPGTSGPTGVGGVPAVSDIGLVILVVLLLGFGGRIIARRSAVAA